MNSTFKALLITVATLNLSLVYAEIIHDSTHAHAPLATLDIAHTLATNGKTDEAITICLAAANSAYATPSHKLAAAKHLNTLGRKDDAKAIYLEVAKSTEATPANKLEAAKYLSNLGEAHAALIAYADVVNSR